MSVVAVRKFKDKIVMAADTQVSWSRSKFIDKNNSLYLEPAKMWKHNNMVIGDAGAVSEGTLFRIFTKTHTPAAATVEGLIDFLVEFNDWAKKKNSDFKLDNHYLIIFEERVFQALSYSVQEVPEYNAIGSGMFLALGAMYKGSDPEEAVEVAKEFDLYCSGKTDVITVKLEEKKEVEKTK